MNNMTIHVEISGKNSKKIEAGKIHLLN